MNNKKKSFLLPTLLLLYMTLLPTKEHTTLMNAICTNNVKSVKKILEEKPNCPLKKALHTSYNRGNHSITSLILKRGCIGVNNKDSHGNTITHKTISDKKINFLKKILSATYKIPLNINKKNQERDTLLHTALNIVKQKAPDVKIIKLLTRHPDLNFHLKNRYSQTPLEQAEENLNFFSTRRNNYLSKHQRKRIIKKAHETIEHIALASDYQRIVQSKNNENLTIFLKHKKLDQLLDISLIALYQNQHSTLRTINSMDNKTFSWLNMLYHAQVSDAPKSIPFLLARLEITPQECFYVLKCVFNPHNATTLNERHLLLNFVKDIYVQTQKKPYFPEIKKTMLATMIMLIKYSRYLSKDVMYHILDYV